MQFGFTLKPEHDIDRTLALTRQAESAGFEYGWLFDSHVLWRDPYPLLTLMAGATSRLRLGTCVTNPGTREPSVTASVAGDARRDQRRPHGPGHRRGDSARRVLGKPPITMAHTEEAINVIRALVAGGSITYEGTELHFPWTRGWTLPIWVAGYGPMAIAMTGRVADGVILQLADPDLIRWFVGPAARGRRRRPDAIPARQGPGGGARRTSARGTWAASGRAGSRRSSSNHVVDLVNKYPREQLPGSLDRLHPDRAGYDYRHHAEVGSSNAGVRRRRGDRPVLRARVGRGARREAARARGRRRRPVQLLPDERRRGAAGPGLREGRHPGLPARPASPIGTHCLAGYWPRCQGGQRYQPVARPWPSRNPHGGPHDRQHRSPRSVLGRRQGRTPTEPTRALRRCPRPGPRDRRLWPHYRHVAAPGIARPRRPDLIRRVAYLVRDHTAENTSRTTHR